MKDLGYPNPVTELKAWRDKGALDCDSQHLTNKAKILSTDDPRRVYVLQVWKNSSPPNTNGSKRDYLIDAYLNADIEKSTEGKEKTDDGNANSTGHSKEAEDLVS